jgi:hypothetical protein
MSSSSTGLYFSTLRGASQHEPIQDGLGMDVGKGTVSSSWRCERIMAIVARAHHGISYPSASACLEVTGAPAAIVDEEAIVESVQSCPCLLDGDVWIQRV